MLGRLRHRVTLQSVSSTIGDGGRKTKTYTAIAEVWAAIEPAHQPPQVRGNKIEYPVSHKITTRYSALYGGARRILYGTREFDVHSLINPGEKNTSLVFRCEEIN
jgi:SPP1 family predicted phage head-tail adaptor